MTQGFLSSIDEPRIVEAIRLAELRSRGEIRVHVTEEEVDDPLKVGAATFERLGMTATGERNGILIFVAPRSQKFAVLGDSGIRSAVDSTAWDEIASALSASFREARFSDGLVGAVQAAGELLARYFPRKAGAADRDELPNSISRG